MSQSQRTQGFHIIEGVLVVAVVALVGFVGYRFWDASHTASAPAAPVTVKDVPQVKSTEDLTTVNKQLDAADIDGSFEADLDAAETF